jgi:hypothetical protein
MIATTIVWNEYPPVGGMIIWKDYYYMVIFKNGEVSCISGDGLSEVANKYGITHIFDPRSIPYIDPTATKFNWQTAKLLMEGGAVCRSIQSFKDASGDDFTIDYKIVDNKLLRHYCLADIWEEDKLSLSELSGEWEKVE